MTDRHIPMRSCIGCHSVMPKEDLIRIAVSDGKNVVDTYKKMPGRGRYICNDATCLEKAIKKHRLSITDELLIAALEECHGRK